MTLAIAWGTPYYTGGPPGTSPFVAGAHGAMPNTGTYDSFTFGLTSPPGYDTVTVTHTYAPSDGGPEVYVDTYYLGYGNDSVSIRPYPNVNGIHKFTPAVAYEPLPVTLELALNFSASGGYYGSAAWYERALAAPAFWTMFIASEEET